MAKATVSAQRPGSLQFGLRAILSSVTLVAIVSAFAAPFIRSLSPEEQRRVLALLVALAAGAIVCTAAMCYFRRRVVRRAGDVLFISTLASLRSVRMNFLTSVVQAAIMLWMIASSVLTGGPWWTQAFLWILAVCCGLQFTLALMYLLWREAMVSVALCEKGILLNALYFHSWESLAGCRWDFARGYLWLTKRQYVLNGYVLPAEQRAEANRIMHEHVAAQGSSTAKTA